MKKAEFLNLIQGYENIIFDYGGVLIDIDYHRAVKKLSELSSEKDATHLYSQAEQIELFDLFETGKVSADDFIMELCQLLHISPALGIQVEEAWNAMLLDLKKERIEVLKEISQNRRLFILSNINIIHEEYMVKYLQQHAEFTGFYELFEKVYFSHHIGLRKPDPEVFQYVLKDAGLDINKTLFIDDSAQHIAGATSIGLKNFHLPSNTLITG